VATRSLDLLGRALRRVFPDVHHRDLRALLSEQHRGSLPIPDPAPVTSATLSLSFIGGFS